MESKLERKEIDLFEYWKVILKRKWIIISFLTVIVILAGVYSFTARPLYRAGATILIDEPTTSLINIQEILDLGISPGPGTYFNTQLELLSSRSLAERVVKKLNLGARPSLESQSDMKRNLLRTVKWLVTLKWLRAKRAPPPDEKAKMDAQDSYSFLADVLLWNLSVRPVEDTRLVNVFYTSPLPSLAAEIVNTVIEEFINYSVETRYEATQQASDFLTDQIAQLREDLSARERELQKYGEEKKILYLNEKENTVVTKFAELSRAFTDAQIQRVEKEAYLKELNSLRIDAMPAYINNPLIQDLKTRYTSAKNEYEEKSRFFLPDYPDMVKLRARMESIRNELQSEIQKELKSAESAYSAAREKEDSLRVLVEGQRQDVQKMNNNAILYNSLLVDVQTKRDLLNSLVAKQNETLVSARIGGYKTSYVKIVDRALVPSEPISPNVRRNLLLAIILGLIGGVALAFAADYLDNTIKGPEDVEKLVGLPSLGIIPHLSPDGFHKKYGRYSGYKYAYRKRYESPEKDKNPSKENTMPEVSEIELINYLYPKFSIAEDYRIVRTSIFFSRSERTPKAIAFTSTFPQEGKTATIANIAISFAQLGGKILVIDADLRKPRLHKIFKVRNLRGLSSYLTSKATLEEIVQKTAIENFWLIPCGPIPPNPAELLNSKKMGDLLNQVKENFDTILIDTPPVLAVIDPVIISSFADATVFIVLAGKTTRRPFVRAVGEIRKAKSDILGVVFNEVKLRKDVYYSSYYHHYQYSYYTDGSEDKLASQEGMRPERDEPEGRRMASPRGPR
jgi:capsular exopolysaccharide synthesis family protein